MHKKQGLTLLEVIVIVIIIFVLIIFFMTALGKVGHIAERVVCGLNLKGLGTAVFVYANDYDDKNPQLPGKGPWSNSLGFAYDFKKPDFNGAQSDTPRTITSSLYLLVREADLSPRTFICPRSNQTNFEGQNSKNLDIVELWDFGNNPYQLR